jgi:prolyl oligopeptidase PreP (S9A serine peptidase family)
VSVEDPFRWLEAENSEETKTFIKDQQTLFDSYTTDTPGFASLQPKLRATMERQYNYERSSIRSIFPWGSGTNQWLRVKA